MEKTTIDERLGASQSASEETGPAAITTRDLINPEELTEKRPWYTPYRVKFALVGSVLLFVAWLIGSAVGIGNSPVSNPVEVPDADLEQIKKLQAQISALEQEKAIRGQGQPVPVKKPPKPKTVAKTTSAKPIPVKRTPIPVIRSRPRSRRYGQSYGRSFTPRPTSVVRVPKPPVTPPKQQPNPSDEFVDNHSLETLALNPDQDLETQQLNFLDATQMDATQISRPTLPLAFGSTAKGKLMTPIMWASDFPAEDQKVLVQLSEDFIDLSTDTVMLPKGSAIEARITKASSAGLVNLDVVSANFEGQTLQIPAGSMAVRSRDGQFLAAKSKGGGSRGPSLFNTLASSLLSGVSAASGELLRSETLTFSNSNGAITQSRSSNALAGLVSGTTQSLARTMQDRLLNRSQPNAPYWLVKAGTRVQLVVTGAI